MDDLKALKEALEAKVDKDVSEVSANESVVERVYNRTHWRFSL